MDRLFGEIGSRIKALRQARSLTQAQVAEAAGIDPSFYGQIERGANVPSVRTLLSVAEALGVEPAQLLPSRKAKERPSPHAEVVRDIVSDLAPEDQRLVAGLVRDMAARMRR